jgi:hypothetical protein
MFVRLDHVLRKMWNIIFGSTPSPVNLDEIKFSRRIEMRKVLSATLICLLAGGKVQPLNVKTGLWQISMSTTMTGLPEIPPEMQARLDQMTPEQRAKIEAMMKSKLGTPQTSSYKKCVTKEDLESNAWNKPDEKCDWTVVTSTGSEMEVKTNSCTAGKNMGMMQTDVDLKIHVVDSENVQATMQLTSNGNGTTMKGNGTYTGKWLGSSCPAGTN